MKTCPSVFWTHMLVFILLKMVKLTISFLIGINRESNLSKISVKSHKADSSISKPSLMNSQSKTSSMLSSQFSGRFVGPFFINCENANRNVFYINYEIFPQKYFHLTLFVYKKMAKICSVDEIGCLRTIQTMNRSWIAFSVIHKVKTMSLEETMKFAGHNINFSISEEKPDDSELDFVDKGGLYYCFNKQNESFDQENVIFEKVYFTRANLIPEVDEYREKIEFENFLKTMPDETFYTSYISAIPVMCHSEKIKKKIEFGEMKRTESLYSNTSRGSVKKSSRKSHLVLTGEELLYDESLWELEADSISHKIKKFAIWVTPGNFLSKKIREAYIPIGIGIKHIDNVPFSDPKIDFTKLSLEYSLGKIIKSFPVVPKYVDRWKKRISFLNFKMYLCKDIPLINVLRTLQFEKLCIKVYAFLKKSPAFPTWDRDTLAVMNRKLFSLGGRDDTISQRYRLKIPHKGHKKSKNTKVLIAFAYVDLSPLLANVFRIDSDAPLTVYDLHHPKDETEISKNALEIHDDFHFEPNDGNYHENIFKNEGTFIKVSIRYGGSNLKKRLNCISLDSEYYSRIIIKLNNCQDFAANIVKRIIELNKSIIPDTFSFLPAVPHWGINLETRIDQEEEFPCALTGFFIDNFNSSLLVLEGFGPLTFNNALLDVFILPTKLGQVLYKSTLLFYEREYKEFLRIGGIFIITLRNHLKNILKIKALKKRGNCPIRALRALNKIEELYLCPTMDFAVRNNSFPYVKDLISFETEFGISHYAMREIPDQ